MIDQFTTYFRKQQENKLNLGVIYLRVFGMLCFSREAFHTRKNQMLTSTPDGTTVNKWFAILQISVNGLVNKSLKALQIHKLRFRKWLLRWPSAVFLQIHRLPTTDGTMGRTQRVHLQLWDTAGQER